MITVLYLEDEPDQVEALSILLNARGFNVIGKTDISEALHVVANQELNVVLMDMMMPPSDDIDPELVEYGRETGIEVARRIKALKPELPIVALTVVGDTSIRAKMLKAGIIAIINKPSDVGPIVDQLNAVARHIGH
jgi:CheY-like chemotaxis protein